MPDSAKPESAAVSYSSDAGIATIKLNRADKRNALTQAMYSLLKEAFDEASNDPKVRVVILTGSGDSFSAGNDMVDFLNAPTATGDSPVFLFMQALANCPKPVIASINGLAIGVGVTMLLHCDLIYASDQSSFQFPFVNIGICPEYASSYLLPRVMGHPRAMELVLFGEPFTAEHARECGLINEVLPTDQLDARVAERAAKLVSQPPNALRTTKSLMKHWTQKTALDAIPVESFKFVPMIKMPEAQEAMSAFVEKRKPDFSSFE